jgi:hypothetical protein
MEPTEFLGLGTWLADKLLGTSAATPDGSPTPASQASLRPLRLTIAALASTTPPPRMICTRIRARRAPRSILGRRRPSETDPTSGVDRCEDRHRCATRLDRRI